MNEFECQISEAYFNSESIRLARINGGHTNLNFIVTHNKDNFFLKLYRYQTKNLVKIEIETICQLVKEGFRTPSVISSSSGDNCVETTEGLVVISEFIDGSQPVPTSHDVYNIGRMTAQLHLITPHHMLKKGYAIQCNTYRDNVANVFKMIHSEFKSFFELIANIGNKIPFANLPTGLAHCDIFLDNMIKDNSSKIYLLDFEEVAIENYLFDIGRAVVGCCIHNKILDLKLARRLVEGYETVRKLSSLEIDYLVDYISYCGGISAFWRYSEFNVKRPNEDKKDFFKEILDPIRMLINKKDHAKSLLTS